MNSQFLSERLHYILIDKVCQGILRLCKHNYSKSGYNMCNMNEFSEWLLEEIEKRGLNYSEIGRRGGPSHARISQVVSGDKPGLDFCTDLARAFRISPESVLRRAGHIPPKPEEEEEFEELVYEIGQMNRQQRIRVLEYAKFITDRDRRESSSTHLDHAEAPA
jgi:transcriptional regulator with XRE-family HTH domain